MSKHQTKERLDMWNTINGAVQDARSSTIWWDGRLDRNKRLKLELLLDRAAEITFPAWLDANMRWQKEGRPD